MIWRSLITALLAAASYAAYMIMGCASFSLAFDAGVSGAMICHEAAEAGMAPGLGTAMWVWGTTVATLIGMWWPAVTASRKKAERAAATLSSNLNRVFDELPSVANAATSESRRIVASGDLTALDVVRQELTRLEELAISGAMPPRDWLALLVELNGLHNEGMISTEMFKPVNTRLISLVAEPMARAEGQTDPTLEPALAGV